MTSDSAQKLLQFLSRGGFNRLSYRKQRRKRVPRPSGVSLNARFSGSVCLLKSSYANSRRSKWLCQTEPHNQCETSKSRGRTERPPKFLYGPEIRVQIGFVLCNAAQKKFSWLQITPHPTGDWARTGIVTANTCGKAVAKPESGELTIFVRPLNFWERMNE